MTIGSVTGIMRQPVCFLIALDANVGLHFDDLNVLTCSKAFSYGVDSGIKNAQVLLSTLKTLCASLGIANVC